MAAEEERKSYVIVRKDGLVIRTKPITVEEARWLEHAYSYDAVRDRTLRARYLGEWGNVMDASEYVERLRQLEPSLYYYITRVYEDPEELVKDLTRLRRLRRLRPEARQAVKELAGEIGEFLQRPVEPRPVEAPVRYLELSHRHVKLGPDGNVYGVDPEPEWYAYVDGLPFDYGVSVFNDSFWVWIQDLFYAWAVAVRRDVDDKDVVAALANDEAVLRCLRNCDYAFRDVINRHGAELTDRGYEDVVRKVKVMLAAADLLSAGRHREGEEGVPA